MGKANKNKNKKEKINFLIIFISASILCFYPEKTFSAEDEIQEDYYVNEYQEIESQAALSPSDRVRLNADRVSFNDETGQAFAEGSAVLTYNDTTIMAERIEYDADTQKVQAMPLPDQKVILTKGNRSIRGDNLNYDLNSREGILTGAVSNISVGEDGGVLYIYGSELSAIPWELANERGLVKGTADDYVIQWRDVVLTTCALDHPHYRLESKNITFIPGSKVVAKKPRVYLGNKYLFTSPLDYVVELKRRAVTYSFIPYVQRSSNRGWGGGITGTIGWDTGVLSLGYAWASKAGSEFMFEIHQEIDKNFSILAGIEYSWDDVWRDRVWRPRASLIYENNGWSARVNWSKNEYIEDQKDSEVEFKGRLERRPEIIIKTPYFKSSKYSWLVITAAYGSFNEAIYGLPDSPNIARYGLTFRNYFERTLNEKQHLELFSDTFGAAWFYDSNNADQEVLRSLTGLRYKFGSVELGTAYEKQRVWGESPMYWDQYRDRERIHQKIRFPLGREVYTSFRGSYDLDEKFLDEMIYSIQWVTDCMVWDLHYKDDRTSGGDDKIGLSLSINAFPDSQASFGQDREIDPFERPREFPKE